MSNFERKKQSRKSQRQGSIEFQLSKSLSDQSLFGEQPRDYEFGFLMQKHILGKKSFAMKMLKKYVNVVEKKKLSAEFMRMIFNHLIRNHKGDYFTKIQFFLSHKRKIGFFLLLLSFYLNSQERLRKKGAFDILVKGYSNKIDQRKININKSSPKAKSVTFEQNKKRVHSTSRQKNTQIQENESYIANLNDVEEFQSLLKLKTETRQALLKIQKLDQFIYTREVQKKCKEIIFSQVKKIQSLKDLNKRMENQTFDNQLTMKALYNTIKLLNEMNRQCANVQKSKEKVQNQIRKQRSEQFLEDIEAKRGKSHMKSELIKLLKEIQKYAGEKNQERLLPLLKKINQKYGNQELVLPQYHLFKILEEMLEEKEATSEEDQFMIRSLNRLVENQNKENLEQFMKNKQRLNQKIQMTPSSSKGLLKKYRNLDKLMNAIIKFYERQFTSNKRQNPQLLNRIKEEKSIEEEKLKDEVVRLEAQIKRLENKVKDEIKITIKEEEKYKKLQTLKNKRIEELERALGVNEHTLEIYKAELYQRKQDEDKWRYKCQKLQIQLEKLKQKFDLFTQEKKKAESSTIQHKAQLQIKTERIKKLQITQIKLKKTVEQLRHQLKQTASNIKHTAKDQIESLREEIQELENRVQKMNENQRKLKQIIDDLNRQISEKDNMLQYTEHAKNEAERMLKQLESKLQEILNVDRKKQYNKRQLQTEIETLKEEQEAWRNKWKEATAEFNRKINDLQKTNAELSMKNKQLIEKNKQFQAEIQDLQTYIQELSFKKQELQGKLRAIQAHQSGSEGYSTLKRQIDSLHNMNEHLNTNFSQMFTYLREKDRHGAHTMVQSRHAYHPRVTQLSQEVQVNFRTFDEEQLKQLRRQNQELKKQINYERHRSSQYSHYKRDPFDITIIQKHNKRVQYLVEQNKKLKSKESCSNSEHDYSRQLEEENKRLKNELANIARKEKETHTRSKQSKFPRFIDDSEDQEVFDEYNETQLQILRRINLEVADLVQLNRKLQLKVAVLENQVKCRNCSGKVNFLLILSEKMQKLIKYLMRKRYIKNGESFANFSQNANSFLLRSNEQQYMQIWQEYMQSLFEEVHLLQQNELKLRTRELNSMHEQMSQLVRSDPRNPHQGIQLQNMKLVMQETRYHMSEYLDKNDPKMLRKICESLGIELV